MFARVYAVAVARESGLLGRTADGDQVKLNFPGRASTHHTNPTYLTRLPLLHPPSDFDRDHVLPTPTADGSAECAPGAKSGPSLCPRSCSRHIPALRADITAERICNACWYVHYTMFCTWELALIVWRRGERPRHHRRWRGGLRRGDQGGSGRIEGTPHQNRACHQKDG
jgi:hypothetical protein